MNFDPLEDARFPRREKVPFPTSAFFLRNLIIADRKFQCHQKVGQVGKKDNCTKPTEASSWSSCPRHRRRLEGLLRELGPRRGEVAEAMAFCVERAEAAEEVVLLISESLSMLHTPLQKKVRTHALTHT